MAKSEELGGNAAGYEALKMLDQDQIAAMLTKQMRTVVANGVTVTTETGMTAEKKNKDGVVIKPSRPFKVLKVKGGDVGSWGWNFNPKTFAALLNVLEMIQVEFKENWQDDPHQAKLEEKRITDILAARYS